MEICLTSRESFSPSASLKHAFVPISSLDTWIFDTRPTGYLTPENKISRSHTDVLLLLKFGRWFLTVLRFRMLYELVILEGSNQGMSNHEIMHFFFLIFTLLRTDFSHFPTIMQKYYFFHFHEISNIFFLFPHKYAHNKSITVFMPSRTKKYLSRLTSQSRNIFSSGV